MTGRTRQMLIGVVLVLGGAMAAPNSVTADRPIAILMSDSSTSTQRTLSGAKKVISRSHPQSTFYTYQLGQDPAQTQALIDSIRAISPHLLMTLGTPATELAKVHFSDIPVVFASVVHPVLSGFVESVGRPGGNMTGASLDIPTHIQFKYFKEIVPHLTDIGVLYTDATASLIRPAQVVAKDMGLRLVALRITDSKQIPDALDSLADVVQGIWSVADPQLFEPQTTRYILLQALRKGIPFMGFSRYVVESGALFALDFDYKAVGFQAGEIATRVLRGESPGKIRVSTVDVIWFHYNEKTARHINLTMPEDLVAIAKEVYR